MALRLIEIDLQAKDSEELRALLKEHTVLEHRQLRFPDGEVLERILLDAERKEAVLDLLAQRYTGEEDNRVVILPVEATLPRAEPEPDAVPGQYEPTFAARRYLELDADEIQAAFKKWLRPDDLARVSEGPTPQ